MVSGLAYGLFTAVMWGLTDVIAALTARRLGSLPTLSLVGLASLVGIWAFAIATLGGLSFASQVAPAAALVGVVSAAGYMAFYTALRLGPIAVVSPVASTYGALTVVLSVVLLGERLTPTQALGAAAATIGIVLVSLRFPGGPRSVRFVGPGVPFAIVACIAWGLVTIGTAMLVRQAEVAPVLLVSRSANVMCIWLVLGLRALAQLTTLCLVTRPNPGGNQARSRAGSDASVTSHSSASARASSGYYSWSFAPQEGGSARGFPRDTTGRPRG